MWCNVLNLTKLLQFLTGRVRQREGSTVNWWLERPASSSYTPDLSSCPLAAQASLVALSESLTHPSRHWSHLTHSDKRKYYPDICRPLSLSITCHSASQCGNLKRIIIQSEYNGLSEKERQVRETRRIICLKLAGWPPGLWQWQQVYSRLK